MPDYFKEALGDFVHNFAYGGVIEHLMVNGYSVDRMISEGGISMSREQIIQMCEKINKRRVKEGKEEIKI